MGPEEFFKLIPDGKYLFGSLKEIEFIVFFKDHDIIDIHSVSGGKSYTYKDPNMQNIFIQTTKFTISSGRCNIPGFDCRNPLYQLVKSDI